MTKKIVLVLAVLVSIFFIVFANIKAAEAEKQYIQAQMNLELAKENEAKAKDQEQKAVEAAARFVIEQKRANDLAAQLANCK